MPHVLLTGGSGFIASHVLDVLLARGHSVVTTVRSEAKAKLIRENHLNAGDKLKFAIVEDIAQPDAFNEAVKSDPPFDYVIHTASPFHFNVTDAKKDLLDPAVIGTTGILKAIKKFAPVVKRVVITSSFAALVDADRNPPNHVYSEKDWNGVTEKEAVENPHAGYRASKTFAEKAAWEFIEKEQPNFDLVTCCPPLVFGPIHPNMQSLDSLNTSNERVRDIISGSYKRKGDKLPPTGIWLYVDVRDLAAAHVDAIEKGEVGGKRYFVCAGHFSNKMIAEAIKKNLPAYANQVPSDLSGGDFPPKDKLPGYDNTRVKEVLGIKFRSWDETILDTAMSIARQL